MHEVFSTKIRVAEKKLKINSLLTNIFKGCMECNFSMVHNKSFDF